MTDAKEKIRLEFLTRCMDKLVEVGLAEKRVVGGVTQYKAVYEDETGLVGWFAVDEAFGQMIERDVMVADGELEVH